MKNIARNNVLLLFAKLPEAGKVKTRLSVLKDGLFSAEDAARLFEAMLLDVIETSLYAFLELSREYPADKYSLVISTAPASNIAAMTALVEECASKICSDNAALAEFSLAVIGDSGSSFDEHYNDAFAQVWDMGADCILSMGADMPALTVDDVVRGFVALHERPDAVVLSPDQEMGVSIVGWTREFDFDHTGVFYNASGLTVLPAYVDKAREAGIPIVYLPPVPDVDTIADLAHNVTLVDALLYAAQTETNSTRALYKGPHRTAYILEDLGISEVRVPPNELRDTRTEIDN